MPAPRSRRAPRRAAAARPSPTAGVQIFGDPPPAPLPPIAVEPLPPIDIEPPPGQVAGPPTAAAGAPSPATGSRFPHPEQEPGVAASSPAAGGVLSLPGRRLSRTRAMAGWDVFLAGPFLASVP